MPRIPELEVALRRHDEYWKSIARLVEERDQVARRLAVLRNRIYEEMAQFEQAVEAARDLQALTLTRWVERCSGQFHRYQLQSGGPTDFTRDGQAWLRGRMMDAGRRWYLLYRVLDDDVQSEMDIEALLEKKGLPITIENLKAEADAGWRLTDLDNDEQE